jgi:hypothetical protein
MTQQRAKTAPRRGTRSEGMENLAEKDICHVGKPLAGCLSVLSQEKHEKKRGSWWIQGIQSG